MTLVTGATGLVGSALVPRLISRGHRVRCLVRDPRNLGAQRVRVQIAMGDLTQVRSFGNAMRGVRTVVHLAAAIRDQRDATIEQLNALATLRLVQAAEAAGVERFIFFSVLGAGSLSPSRFLRSKALAEDAVSGANLEGVVVAPSWIYSPNDKFMRLLRRLSRLPVMPVPGEGRARCRPLWVDDVAEATVNLVESGSKKGRYELMGPTDLSIVQIIGVAQDAFGSRKPLMHIPLDLIRPCLDALERLAGERAPVTWDEVELMGISMTGRAEDMRQLGVTAKPMREVLGLVA